MNVNEDDDEDEYNICIYHTGHSYIFCDPLFVRPQKISDEQPKGILKLKFNSHACKKIFNKIKRLTDEQLENKQKDWELHVSILGENHYVVQTIEWLTTKQLTPEVYRLYFSEIECFWWGIRHLIEKAAFIRLFHEWVIELVDAIRASDEWIRIQSFGRYFKANLGKVQEKDEAYSHERNVEYVHKILADRQARNVTRWVRRKNKQDCMEFPNLDLKGIDKNMFGDDKNAYHQSGDVQVLCDAVTQKQIKCKIDDLEDDFIDECVETENLQPCFEKHVLFGYLESMHHGIILELGDEEEMKNFPQDEHYYDIINGMESAYIRRRIVNYLKNAIIYAKAGQTIPRLDKMGDDIQQIIDVWTVGDRQCSSNIVKMERIVLRNRVILGQKSIPQQLFPSQKESGIGYGGMSGHRVKLLKYVNKRLSKQKNLQKELAKLEIAYPTEILKMLSWLLVLEEQRSLLYPQLRSRSQNVQRRRTLRRKYIAVVSLGLETMKLIYQKQECWLKWYIKTYPGGLSDDWDRCFNKNYCEYGLVIDDKYVEDFKYNTHKIIING